MADEEVAAAQEEVTQLNEDLFDVRRGPTADEDGGAFDAFVVEEDWKRLFDAFALFDADGDGKLTEDEVMAVLTRKTGRGTELSEEAARATWRRWQANFDTNKDGKISYKELEEGELLEEKM